MDGWMEDWTETMEQINEEQLVKHDYSKAKNEDQ